MIYSVCSFFRYSQFYSPITRLTTPIFDHTHPENFQATFNLYKFVPKPACKKIVNSMCSFFRYNQFQIPETRLATSIFEHAQPKNFQSAFNFHEFVSTCKK